ncbi:MAG TPA: hypothetical protein VJS42_03270 [Steroidobacteraceae bacterium]|nr:hypothetical protein [Steroidobacteraceae bacterium]
MSRAILLVMLAIAASACVTIPNYQLPDGASHARVHLIGDWSGANLWMCLDNQQYLLKNDASGYADIPADRRLTLGVSYYNYVYNGVSTPCQASSSLIPQNGASYVVNFEIEAEHCTALSYKETKSNRIGLDFEPTLQPAMSCSNR